MFPSAPPLLCLLALLLLPSPSSPFLSPLPPPPTGSSPPPSRSRPFSIVGAPRLGPPSSRSYPSGCARGYPPGHAGSSTALSGIRGFRAWFSSNFESAYRTVDSAETADDFDHVLVDCNQILHQVHRSAANETVAFMKMFREIDGLLRFARPGRSVVFAFDGPPSSAKLSTQRRRRTRALVDPARELFDELYDLKPGDGEVEAYDAPPNAGRPAAARPAAGLNQTDFAVNLSLPPSAYAALCALPSKFPCRYPSPLSSLLSLPAPPPLSLRSLVSAPWLTRVRKRRSHTRRADARVCDITPGTAFMKAAVDALLYFIYQRAAQGRYRNVKWYVSGADVPGEGEVKVSRGGGRAGRERGAGRGERSGASKERSERRAERESEEERGRDGGRRPLLLAQ